jgi:hypothetical protein
MNEVLKSMNATDVPIGSNATGPAPPKTASPAGKAILCIEALCVEFRNPEWQTQESAKAEPDKFLFLQIASHLAMLEDKQGNYAQALTYIASWKQRSPNPDAVQKLIDEVQRKAASASSKAVEQQKESTNQAP